MSFFITTPIYYVNDKPHIGHAYTSIACDIISRFHKLNGNDVYFLSGTDEHGQKVEKAAKDSNKETKLFVDDMSENFQKLIPFLNCEINDFIRTTEIRHKLAAQNLWNKLKENGQIYLSNYEGWYSVRDEAFYQETELNKKDNKFYAPSGAPVEWVKEESYFFKLSSWEKKLISFYENNPNAILPKTRYNEVLSFIKSGLRDLSISRTTFKWGIDVPDNDGHVMYVWIDALCNYLTSIGYPDIENDKFKKFWPGIHVVGKDILRFHAVYWPAFLMAANLKPPKQIFAHGWWTNNGQKISKSLGNVIDPYEIIKLYGLDQIRFFLFREVPFGNDGDFSNSAISKRINADLANNYGNLVQRTSTFIIKNSNSKVNFTSKFNTNDEDLINLLNKITENYKNFMQKMRIDRALKSVFELLSEANSYLDSQAPWKVKNNDLERMNTILYLATNIIIKCTIMLYPVIPDSSDKVLKIFNINKDLRNFINLNKLIDKDIYINDPSPIFPRLDQ